MSIIRVRKDARYFTASNEPFVDEKLSWEARGLMGYLLTKPDNWQVRTFDLTKKGPAKDHKIRRMLAELRKAGYMNRIRVTLPGGKFDWITEVYESPNQNTKRKTSGGFSTSGSTTSGKVPDIESTETLNTESSKERREEIAPLISGASLSVENQIAIGVDKIAMPTEEQELVAQRDMAVFLITQRGNADLEGLARAFIETRGTMPTTKKDAKSWSSVLREMKNAGATPKIVRDAVLDLVNGNMRCVDPYSIRKTVLDMATPMPSNASAIIEIDSNGVPVTY